MRAGDETTDRGGRRKPLVRFLLTESAEPIVATAIARLFHLESTGFDRLYLDRTNVLLGVGVGSAGVIQ